MLEICKSFWKYWKALLIEDCDVCLFPDNQWLCYQS